MRASCRLLLTLAAVAVAAGLWLTVSQPPAPSSASVDVKPTSSGFHRSAAPRDQRDTGILPVRGTGFQPVPVEGFQPMAGRRAVPPDRGPDAPQQDAPPDASAIDPPAIIARDSTTTTVPQTAPDVFGLTPKRELLARKLRAAAVPGPPVFPLIFHDVPAAETVPDPALDAAIEQLRDDFADEIDNTGAAPNEPRYLEKWQRAQPLSDWQLRARIGQEAFARWQTEAYLARTR